MCMEFDTYHFLGYCILSLHYFILLKKSRSGEFMSSSRTLIESTKSILWNSFPLSLLILTTKYSFTFWIVEYIALKCLKALNFTHRNVIVASLKKLATRTMTYLLPLMLSILIRCMNSRNLVASISYELFWCHLTYFLLI